MEVCGEWDMSKHLHSFFPGIYFDTFCNGSLGSLDTGGLPDFRGGKGLGLTGRICPTAPGRNGMPWNAMEPWGLT